MPRAYSAFTSFPPSRRVRFAPKSGHSAIARVYEYTPQPPAAVIGELSAGGLARLAVIGAVRPHVGRRCKPIGHVVEGRDGSDVPDVAIGEARATQALAVFLFDFPRLGRELDREIEHGASALIETCGSIVHHHHLAQEWTAELAYCVAVRGNAIEAPVLRRDHGSDHFNFQL